MNKKFLTVADVMHNLSTIPQDTLTDIAFMGIERDAIDSIIYVCIEVKSNDDAKVLFLLDEV